MSSVTVPGFAPPAAERGFSSIPLSMFWAIVTLTTVGYGDVAPQTPLGQSLASVLMLLGYGIIAVPTGIVSAEIARTERAEAKGLKCARCEVIEPRGDARFCRVCGGALQRSGLGRPPASNQDSFVARPPR